MADQLAVFNPAIFKTSTKPRHIEICFEGPADPNKKLPSILKKKQVLSDDVYLVGYRGKAGCFSVRKDSADALDIAYYPEAKPESLSDEDVWNAIYASVPCVPGWGFSAIAGLREVMGL